MISSEVQRTLVKSPPELWAELSDPQALGRHLGEFGEIRITRVEPERKVEWEADDASGSVVIKPSGWGTKVKLTVRRTLSESETETETESASTAQAPPAAPTEAHDPGEPDDRASQAEIAAEAPPAPTSAPSPLAMPATHAGFARVAAPSQPQPAAPAAQAALEDASEDASTPEPALEEPAAAESVEPQTTTEPRRGFFARLFGRRPRAQPAQAAGTAEADAEPAEPAETPVDPAPADEPAAPTLEAAPGEAGMSTELAAHEAALDQPAAALPAPSSEAAPAGPGSAFVVTDARTPDAPPDAPHTAESLSVAGQRAEPEPEPAQAPQAPAAEVKSAEELAVEQATAVLTSVLDRLGAAHHRPFSRA